jgi:hypothetical protein
MSRSKSALSFFVINYFFRIHWRLKIREGEPPGEPKSGAGAKCGVQLLKAEKLFGSAEALPSKTTYHSLYSLLTFRCRSTSRQSLFTSVSAWQEPRPPVVS